MIRIYVIEDDATIIIPGFKRLFISARDGIKVAGFSNSVEETICKANPSTFDVFILDLWLENRIPIINIRNLKKNFPYKPVVIYTSETSFAWRSKMINEKASAYITKSSTRTELKTGIEKAARGELYFPANLSDLQRSSQIITDISLTPEESLILHLIKKGMSHSEIADNISKSNSMVDKILKSLRVKYRAKNNFDLLSILNI